MTYHHHSTYKGAKIPSCHQWFSCQCLLKHFTCVWSTCQIILRDSSCLVATEQYQFISGESCIIRVHQMEDERNVGCKFCFVLYQALCNRSNTRVPVLVWTDLRLRIFYFSSHQTAMWCSKMVKLLAFCLWHLSDSFLYLALLKDRLVSFWQKPFFVHFMCHTHFLDKMCCKRTRNVNRNSAFWDSRLWFWLGKRPNNAPFGRFQLFVNSER